MTLFTIDTAPADVLRREYRRLLEEHRSGRDDRNIGWWITHNAAAVTITTHTGETLTSTGKELLGAIKAYHQEESRTSAWRAA